ASTRSSGPRPARSTPTAPEPGPSRPRRFLGPDPRPSQAVDLADERAARGQRRAAVQRTQGAGRDALPVAGDAGTPVASRLVAHRSQEQLQLAGVRARLAGLLERCPQATAGATQHLCGGFVVRGRVAAALPRPLELLPVAVAPGLVPGRQ